MTIISKEIVLNFLEDNPHITTKRDIARALHITGKGRTELRHILKELEDDGKLERTAKRAYAKADTCLLYTSPSPRDKRQSRMPSSA